MQLLKITPPANANTRFKAFNTRRLLALSHQKKNNNLLFFQFYLL